jgi:hypothetical protein
VRQSKTALAIDVSIAPAPQRVSGIRYHSRAHCSPNRGVGVTTMTIWRSPCPTCNFHKSVHLEGFDEHERTQVRLFNPRTDDWHSHFAFQELTLRVSAHGTSTCPRRSTLPASRKDGDVPTKVRKTPRDLAQTRIYTTRRGFLWLPKSDCFQAANFGGLIPTESWSFSSEKSYSPSRLICCQDTTEPLAMAWNRISRASGPMTSLIFWDK